MRITQLFNRWFRLMVIPVAVFASRPLKAEILDHWTTQQVSTNWFGLTHVVYGNGRFVAAGPWSDYAVVLTSEDGFNWTRWVGTNQPGGSYIPNYLKVEGTRFLITGPILGNGLGVATNGADWRFRNLPDFDPITHSVRAAAFGNGVYVVGYSLGNQNKTNLAYSNNGGVNWSSDTYRLTESGDLEGIGFSVRDIAFNGKFIAIADAGHTYDSTDGWVWQRRLIAGGNTITWAGGKWLVPLSAGTNLVSANGTTWTATPTGLTNLLGKIQWVNGMFYARASNYVALSLNGADWMQYGRFGIPGDGIAFNGSRFVTVSGSFSAYIYISDPVVELSMTAIAPSQLSLSGIVGRSYRIEYSEQFPPGGTNIWQTLTNLVLPANPCLFDDPAFSSNMQRFYRAVLLP